MNIVSRQDALVAGLKRYFTGAQCPHGHTSARYVSTMQCIECIKAYAPKWQKAHPAQTAATTRKWRKANPERMKERKSASQKRNRASANARQQRYVEANREAVYARTEAWAKANPGKVTARAMRYHADRLQRTPAWADQDAITRMYELAAVFRGIGLDLEVDHDIPLRGKRVSGLHVHDNLLLIHATRNKQKSNHFEGA